MKPQQLQMLADLSKCWIESRYRWMIRDWNYIDTETRRWLWNRYRNQIRHANRKDK